MRRNNQDINNHQHLDKTKPYIILGAIGVTLIFASVMFNILKWEILQQICLNLGVSTIAVVVVEIFWRKFGGDPITKAISSLWRATNLLRELEASGINSITIPRRKLEQPEQIDLWCKLLSNATHVDLMALSLRAEITRHKELMKAIENAILLHSCQVRIITLCPFQDISECNSIALQRINEEKRLAGGEGAIDRARGNLKDTWGQFKRIQDKLNQDHERKDCLQIKFTIDITIYTNIIRIDDRMWVSPYSASIRGGDNPVFEIAGIHSALFQHFHDEFNHMWAPPSKR